MLDGLRLAVKLFSKRIQLAAVCGKEQESGYMDSSGEAMRLCTSQVLRQQ